MKTNNSTPITIGIARNEEGKAILAFGENAMNPITTEIIGLSEVIDTASAELMDKINAIINTTSMSTPAVTDATRAANAALLAAHAADEEAIESVLTKDKVMAQRAMLPNHLGMLSATANVNNTSSTTLIGLRQHEYNWESNQWRELLERVHHGDLYQWITSVRPEFNPDEQDAYDKWAHDVAVNGINVINEFGVTKHLVKLGVGANGAKEGQIYFCPAMEEEKQLALRDMLICSGILGVDGLVRYNDNGVKVGMSHIKETAAVCYGSNVGYRTNASIGKEDSILFVSGKCEALLRRIEASVRSATAKVVDGNATQDLTDGMMIICGKVAKELGLSIQQVRYMGVKGAAHCLPYTFLRIVTDLLPWINWSEFVIVDAEGQEWSFNPTTGQHDLNKVEMVLTSSALKIAKQNGFEIEKYQAAAIRFWNNRLTMLGTNHQHRGGYTSLQQMQALDLSEEDLKTICSIKERMEHLGEFAASPEEWAAGEYPLAGIMPGFLAFEEVRTAAERAWEYERITDAASRVIAYDATEKCAVDLRTLLCIFLGLDIVPAMKTRQVWCAKAKKGLVAAFRDPNTSEWAAQVCVNHLPFVSGDIRRKYYAKDAIHVGIVDMIDGIAHAYDLNLFLQLDYDGDKLRLCSIPEVVNAVLRRNVQHPIGSELGAFGKAAAELNTIDSEVRSEVGACLGSEMGKPANLYFMVQASGLPQSVKDKIAAAYPDNSEAAIAEVTDWTKFWLEILTWLLIDSSKHGSDRIHEVLSVLMSELKAEMVLPLAKRADKKGLVAARVREHALKTDSRRHCPDVTFEGLTTLSGTPFATVSSGNASDMNYVNFMSVDMPVMDYSQYKFNVNVLLTMPAKMTELVRPFAKDNRDALTRWNAMCDKYFGLCEIARNVRADKGEDSREYKAARAATAAFLEQIRASYTKLADASECAYELVYNQDTLAAFGCLLNAWTDRDGVFYPAGRIQWERGMKDKKVAPAINRKTGAYMSRGLSLWMKLWGEHALETLKAQWTAEELKAISFKAHTLVSVAEDEAVKQQLNDWMIMLDLGDTLDRTEDLLDSDVMDAELVID